MPWMETAPMEQRERFIADSWACHFTMTELCRRYGISRKTGYKWLHRHAEEGRSGLQDRSHAPHSCPHRMTPEIGELILAGRRRHPIGGHASCWIGWHLVIRTSLPGRPSARPETCWPARDG